MKRTEIILFGILAVAGLLGCQSARGPRFDARVTSPATFVALTNLAIVTPTNQLNADLLKPLADRFKLGPGDVLNFALFDRTELTRNEIAIEPDGRVSYLQAQGIVAAGLTIDELRAKMDEVLASYYRAPRTIITRSRFTVSGMCCSAASRKRVSSRWTGR